MVKNREFIKRNTELLLVICVLFLLDTFVPDSFYNDVIDHMRIFKTMGICFSFTLLFVNVMYLFETRKRK